MIRLVSIFILFSLLIPLKSYSQILNIEKFRLKKDTSNALLGTVGFGFSHKKQRTDVLEINANTNAVYLTDSSSYMLLSNLSFINVDDNDVISEGYIHSRANFFRQRWMSYEAFGQIQYDAGRGLESRSLIGGALRFNIHSDEFLELSVNHGIIYEHEDWIGNVITNLIKYSSSVTMRIKITKWFHIISITYYQARLDDLLTPRLTTDSSIQLSLNENFAFRFQYAATYDENPPIDIENLIAVTRSTLVYKF